MALDKSTLRVDALRRRGLLSEQDRDAAAQALARAVPPLATGPVAAYASVGAEPATGPLLERLGHALLPVLQEDGDLDWAAYEGELVPGPRGTLQPPGPLLGRDAVADCRVVVVPALAVDRAGTRLGRGGGAYDRALVRATGLVVAALHTGELALSLPAEPHDRPVHAAVLPDRGLVRLRPHPLDGLGAGPGEIDP